MEIRIAGEKDLKLILSYDVHIKEEKLKNLLKLGRVFLAEEDGEFVGWMRYNLFWDNTPFMNMLFFLEGKRGKGYGRKMVSFWEERMKKEGYETVMTSSASDEWAQHFYRKLGYQTVGGFTPDGDPFELIFSKHL